MTNGQRNEGNKLRQPTEINNRKHKRHSRSTKNN